GNAAPIDGHPVQANPVDSPFPGAGPGNAGLKRGRTEPPRSRVKPGQPPTGVPKILRTDIRDGVPGDPGQQDIALDVTGKGVPSRTGAKGYGNPTGFRKAQVPPRRRHPSPVGLPSLPRPLQG